MARSRRTLSTSKKEKTKINPQQGSGIRCPSCNGATKVMRTEPHPEISMHGRYRKCDECGKRIYTEEVITIDDIQVHWDEQRALKNQLKKERKGKKVKDT